MKKYDLYVYFAPIEWKKYYKQGRNKVGTIALNKLIRYFRIKHRISPTIEENVYDNLQKIFTLHLFHYTNPTLMIGRYTYNEMIEICQVLSDTPFRIKLHP